MKTTDRSIPLQEPTIYIMLSLRNGVKHGYAIQKEVNELSEKRIKLSTGTLYGALYRLLDQGLIEQVELKDSLAGEKGLSANTIRAGGLRHRSRSDETFIACCE